jgi:hypothetical protein
VSDVFCVVLLSCVLFFFFFRDVYFVDGTLVTCVLMANVRDYHTPATRTHVTKIPSTKYTYMKKKKNTRKKNITTHNTLF